MSILPFLRLKHGGKVDRHSMMKPPISALFTTPCSKPVSICLVRPPTIANVTFFGEEAVPPLGLAYLAGSLKAAGHDVSAVDAVGEAIHQYSRVSGIPKALLHGLTPSEIAARIDKRTEVIGVSCMFSVEWLSARSVIEEIRRVFPRALILLGGEHINALPEYVLNDCRAADVAVLGEGEETLLDLLKIHSEGGDLAQVPGIFFRRDGAIVSTGRRQRISSIDDIPEPDWSCFPIEVYIENGLTFGANLGRCIPILASRGCPYQCTFCSNPMMWTTKWSARKPENVLAEIRKYRNQYQVTNFDFYDLTAIVKKDWIIAFCKLLIAENLNITWQLPSGTRSEAIDHEVAVHLYQSGCRILNYAPESGSPEELRRIKKMVKIDRMLDSMRAAHKAKLELKVNFIFGLPGAQWSDLWKTLKFVTRLAVLGVEDISTFPFSPYPGSELFATLTAAGKIRLHEDYFNNLLLTYTDLGKSVSFTDNFSARTLRTMGLLTLIYFYGLNFLFRPQRFFKLIFLLLAKESSTKLTMALSNRRKKKTAMELSRKLEKGKVILGELVPH